VIVCAELEILARLIAPGRYRLTPRTPRPAELEDRMSDEQRGAGWAASSAPPATAPPAELTAQRLSTCRRIDETR
jgi:hypothetical protein